MDKHILLNNLDRIHTTEMGVDRIKKNLSLNDDADVLDLCRKMISDDNAVIGRQGKNWYVRIDGCVLTVNANSYTIITAHREK
ncbi:MAG: DUF3781 domain-containing protein [Lachnospiraceae bacterium]|nr:DUF3781 domain-containing protein [Lachnospiraceae bacterium]